MQASNYGLMYGAILQEPMPQWVEAARQWGRGGWEFFQTESATEAQNYNWHLVFNSKRHYIAHQDPYLYASDHHKAARDFFATFVDGTFAQHASTIWGVNELNEYFGGESPEDRQKKINWARACAEVWANDYRSQQRYEHIKLILCRVAVGNDIPIEVAEAAQRWDAGLSYHGYVPVHNGLRLGQGAQLITRNRKGSYVATSSNFRENVTYRVAFRSAPSMDITESEDVAWKYYAGRWTEMDAYYKANGITVPFWISTEGLPVGYSQYPNGDIALHPWDGWRHPNVCGHQMSNYIQHLEWYGNKCVAWNEDNDERYVGMRLFVSNIRGWDYFRHTTEELIEIANWQNQWNPDPGPGPDPDDRERLLYDALNSECIVPIAGAALGNSISRAGHLWLGNEFQFTDSNGVLFVCQSAYNVNEPNARYVHKVVYGDWGNITIEYYDDIS